MFQAKIKNLIIFKKIIDSLIALVNEVNLYSINLKIKEEGFKENVVKKNKNSFILSRFWQSIKISKRK